MNQILWTENIIGIITNQFNSTTHKHWMLQLFISLEENDLEVIVEKGKVKGKAVLLGMNVEHAFYSDEQLHLSLLIDPTCAFAMKMESLLEEKEYRVLDFLDIGNYQRQLYSFIKQNDIRIYRQFLNQLTQIKTGREVVMFDEHIEQFLRSIENCNCTTHTIDSFAQHVSLSSSRFSHLFKQETGVPLKSYILLHQMKETFHKILQNVSITEAALSSGFDSSAHFASTTKKMMGIATTKSLKDSVFLKVE